MLDQNRLYAHFVCSSMINWHRLFGLALDDYFTGTQYSVEMENDIARKRQGYRINVLADTVG